MKKLHILLHLLIVFFKIFKLDHSVENLTKFHDFFDSIPASDVLKTETLHLLLDTFAIKHDDKEVNSFFRLLFSALSCFIKVV
jgi:hypothetical protein